MRRLICTFVVRIWLKQVFLYDVAQIIAFQWHQEENRYYKPKYYKERKNKVNSSDQLSLPQTQNTKAEILNLGFSLHRFIIITVKIWG